MPKKGYKQTKDHKRNIRESVGDKLKGKIPWNKGKELSKEHCKKLSESHSGYKMSEKQKIKISEKLKIMFKEGKLKITGVAKKYHDDPKSHHRYIDGRSYNKGPYRYGDDWEAIRLLIYARDNFTCQECGERMSKIPFHVHHKIPFLQSFDNSPKNLITLCPSCHRKIESQISKLMLYTN